MQSKTSPHRLAPPLVLTLLAVLGDSQAATTYTDRAAFLAATAGMARQTLDFESETAGTTLPDPSPIGGVTFSGYGTPALIIADDFEATSGVNYLGIDSAGTFNQFSYADSVDLGFASMHALGLNIITAEVPGVTLFDDDIRVDVPGIGIVRLDADDVDSVTPGGDRVYFLGIVDVAGFTSARLEGSGAFGFYNVDDVTMAVVPEPSVKVALAVFGPLMLAACWSRRRTHRQSSSAASPS